LTLFAAAVQAVFVADHAERMRVLFPLYDSDGIEAVIPWFEPDVAWMSPPEWMDSPVYCGHQGLRDLDTLWKSNFDEYRLQPEDVRAVDADRLVVLLHMHGRIKGTSQEIHQRASWLVDFSQAGLVSRCCAYFSWEEALEAARRD
jgi:hypothetical protein